MNIIDLHRINRTDVEIPYGVLGIDRLSLDAFEDDVLCYHWIGTYKTHKATLQRCEWAKRLHGNAPAGTRYGYFKIQDPCGYRINLNVYI